MKNGRSTFSTVDCIENLQGAGFTPEQAQAQAKEFENSRGDLMTLLASKHDVELIKKDIEQLRKETAEIRKETAEIKKDTKDQTLKIIGVLGGLMAILKFLPDFFN